MAKLLAEIAQYDPELAKSITVPDGAEHSQLLGRCLEALTAHFINAVNTRNIRLPLANHFFSPSFVWRYDSGAVVRSLEELMNRMEEAVVGNSQYRLDIYDMYSTVDEKHGTATVWMCMRSSGHPGEDSTIVRDVVGQERWERLDGRWYWVSHTAMRGFGPVGGGLEFG